MPRAKPRSVRKEDGVTTADDSVKMGGDAPAAATMEPLDTETEKVAFSVGTSEASVEPTKTKPKTSRKAKVCDRCEERRKREREYARASRTRVRLAKASAAEAKPEEASGAPAPADVAVDAS